MLRREKNRITKIPYPGSSGTCPSGAMEFEHDWPGLWLRGDEALSLHTELMYFKEKVLIPKGIKSYPNSLEVILEIIIEDVRVKPGSGKERLFD